MNNINKYIQEKLIINKNVNVYNKILSNLCDFFGSTKDETKFLEKYFNIDEDECEELLNYKVEPELICSPGELFVMLAYMLIDDNLGCQYYSILGISKYKTKFKGKNNPYDYSWFEEQGWTNEDEDILMSCQDWIQNNYTEFNQIYKFVKKHYSTISKNGGVYAIFYMHTKIFY